MLGLCNGDGDDDDCVGDNADDGDRDGDDHDGHEGDDGDDGDGDGDDGDGDGEFFKVDDDEQPLSDLLVMVWGLRLGGGPGEGPPPAKGGDGGPRQLL